MLEKIKARLPGGMYFKELKNIFNHLISGRFTPRDKYILLTYFIGNGYAINKIYNQFINEKNKENYTTAYIMIQDINFITKNI